jgi:hypothetical protein
MFTVAKGRDNLVALILVQVPCQPQNLHPLRQ